MSDEIKDLRQLMRELTQVRTTLLNEQPFFGRLLLHMPFAFANVETACTDMKNIIFDPAFLSALDFEEMKFLMLHELYHCVLHHCTRGREFIPLIHNIACDVVVNSLILESMQLDTFVLDGEEVMHLAPDGLEGRLYTAEQVYYMLLKKHDDLSKIPPLPNTTDNHGGWGKINNSQKNNLDSIWSHRIENAVKACGNSSSGIPYRIERYLAEFNHHPQTNWRQILHDLIQHDRCDYTFMTPDRRFSTSDFIFPSFQEDIDGDSVRKLWFLIDTSGSISDKALAEAMYEITDAMNQIGHLQGWLSFFDVAVSKPAPFENPEELFSIKPIGGGGTSFFSIFKKMPEYFEDELPAMVLILTDGYATVPDEKLALGVPVVWIIIDSNEQPEWGTVVHVDI